MAGAPSGDGRRRRRAGARFRQRPLPAAPPAAPERRGAAPAPARASRLLLAVALLGGILIGAFAQKALAGSGLQRWFFIAVATAFALGIAMAYRRWVRGLIEARRRLERDR